VKIFSIMDQYLFIPKNIITDVQIIRHDLNIHLKPTIQFKINYIHNSIDTTHVLCQLPSGKYKPSFFLLFPFFKKVTYCFECFKICAVPCNHQQFALFSSTFLLRLIEILYRNWIKVFGYPLRSHSPFLTQ
jgi:hypothetical protein